MSLFPGVMDRSAAFVWFRESQLQSVISNGIVPEWFHGIISRKAAEELLMSKLPGYFLIRVSESRIGYTLSYRAEDRCRHFMIDALVDGRYVIVGERKSHRTLQDLVDFHRRAPIIPFNEVLTVACGQTSNEKSDYAELLFPQKHPNTNVQPNNSPLLSPSHSDSQQEIPPALPYRPNNLRSSAVLSPNSQSNQHYPNIEEMTRQFTYPSPAMDFQPVPATRKRYVADKSASIQPPEVPARSPVPSLRQDQACMLNIAEPESALTPTEPQLNSNTESLKNQEAKSSVVTNLKGLKKKFQKRIMSQDSTYTEINIEATDTSRNTASEEITGEKTINCPNFSSTNATEGGLPQEYLPPPPFAPGY